MANTAVQLAANTEVNEVSEGVSHRTTVSFTLTSMPMPPSPPTPDGIYCLGKSPLPHLYGRYVCKEKPFGGRSNSLSNELFTPAPPNIIWI